MFAHLRHVQLNELFKFINKKVFESALKQIEVKFNHKLTKCTGRYHLANQDRPAFIDISSHHCTDMKTTDSVLAHEMCHAAQIDIEGEEQKARGERRDMHGASFKKWATIATAKLGESIFPVERCHRPDVKVEKKFIATCQKCQCSHQASRRGTICRRCKGPTLHTRNISYVRPLRYEAVKKKVAKKKPVLKKR